MFAVFLYLAVIPCFMDIFLLGTFGSRISNETIEEINLLGIQKFVSSMMMTIDGAWFGLALLVVTLCLYVLIYSFYFLFVFDIVVFDETKADTTSQESLYNDDPMPTFSPLPSSRSITSLSSLSFNRSSSVNSTTFSKPPTSNRLGVAVVLIVSLIILGICSWAGVFCKTMFAQVTSFAEIYGPMAIHVLDNPLLCALFASPTIVKLPFWLDVISYESENGRRFDEQFFSPSETFELPSDEITIGQNNDYKCMLRKTLSFHGPKYLSLRPFKIREEIISQNIPWFEFGRSKDDNAGRQGNFAKTEDGVLLKSQQSFSPNIISIFINSGRYEELTSGINFDSEPHIFSFAPTIRELMTRGASWTNMFSANFNSDAAWTTVSTGRFYDHTRMSGDDFLSTSHRYLKGFEQVLEEKKKYLLERQVTTKLFYSSQRGNVEYGAFENPADDISIPYNLGSVESPDQEFPVKDEHVNNPEVESVLNSLSKLKSAATKNERPFYFDLRVPTPTSLSIFQRIIADNNKNGEKKDNSNNHDYQNNNDDGNVNDIDKNDGDNNDFNEKLHSYKAHVLHSSNSDTLLDEDFLIFARTKIFAKHPTLLQSSPDKFHAMVTQYVKVLKDVHTIDGFIWKIIQGLKARGMAEDTLIVITSEHASSIHHNVEETEFDEQFKVPFIVSDLLGDVFDKDSKDYQPGIKINDISSNIDVGSTLLDLLDIKNYTNFGLGQSLIRRPRRVVSIATANETELTNNKKNEDNADNSNQSRMTISNFRNVKILRNDTHSSIYERAKDGPYWNLRTYDRRSDPDQLENVPIDRIAYSDKKALQQLLNYQRLKDLWVRGLNYCADNLVNGHEYFYEDIKNEINKKEPIEKNKHEQQQQPQEENDATPHKPNSIFSPLSLVDDDYSAVVFFLIIFFLSLIPWFYFYTNKKRSYKFCFCYNFDR